LPPRQQSKGYGKANTAAGKGCACQGAWPRHGKGKGSGNASAAMQWAQYDVHAPPYGHPHGW
jgi:hypothetical protein